MLWGLYSYFRTDSLVRFDMKIRVGYSMLEGNLLMAAKELSSEKRFTFN